MGLNKQKGNMYGFVTHTWNTVKGKCPHDCPYCYMKRYPQTELHFDEKELKTDLGEENFIFVGSSCDMFADDIPPEWIIATLMHCEKFNNEYLFQTKNPEAYSGYGANIAAIEDFVLCTTIETNRFYSDYMGSAPGPRERSLAMQKIPYNKKHVTIEPIMDFDLEFFLLFLLDCNPIQVNIGADSGGNNLPEPDKEKINTLIEELKNNNIQVHLKNNLKRLIKP